MTRAWINKLKASNGNEDNVMVAYMEEALKNNKDYSREQFDVKMAKYGREGTLPPMVALPLPSPVGFCQPMLENLIPTTDGKFPMFLIGTLNLKILNRGSSREGGDPWEGAESKLQSKVGLH
ncbi:hypothetical protein M9H77_17475 [Catharanthus roseus]|uniref:Uncharacterized protein n=1 Tax=Catharanthus roseus TaxID=4058 RepID=A0ACC0B4P6_CATRO|nr:hypothetical protein M9H77_17475 [Catharanthus roseus]